MCCVCEVMLQLYAQLTLAYLTGGLRCLLERAPICSSERVAGYVVHGAQPRVARCVLPEVQGSQRAPRERHGRACKLRPCLSARLQQAGCCLKRARERDYTTSPPAGWFLSNHTQVSGYQGSHAKATREELKPARHNKRAHQLGAARGKGEARAVVGRISEVLQQRAAPARPSRLLLIHTRSCTQA